MIASALADVMPGAERALTALADRIGRNREVAGVHYPSDTLAGKQIACAAFDLLQQCPSYKLVRDAARKEPGGPGELPYT